MESTRAPAFPVGKVMVLGHNFDSKKNYHISLQKGSEDVKKNPTWRNLVQFLANVGIAPEDIFFTNFFMGLIADRAKPIGNTGTFPGAHDAAFVQRCQGFFLKQVDLQQPRVILVLGLKVPKYLSNLARPLEPWSKAKTFAAIDPHLCLIRNVVFHGLAHPTTLAVLTHPSYRPRNVKYRSYAGLRGGSAEIRLIEDALSSTH